MTKWVQRIVAITVLCCLVLHPSGTQIGPSGFTLHSKIAQTENPNVFLQTALSAADVSARFQRNLNPKLAVMVIVALITFGGMIGLRPTPLVAQTTTGNQKVFIDRTLKHLRWDDLFLNQTNAEVEIDIILNDARAVAETRLTDRELRDLTAGTWNLLWKIYGELEHYGDPEFSLPDDVPNELKPAYHGGKLYTLLHRFNRDRSPEAQLHWTKKGLADSQGNPWSPSKGNAAENAFFSEFSRVMQERNSLKSLESALLQLDENLRSQRAMAPPTFSDHVARWLAQAAHDKARENLEKLIARKDLKTETLPDPSFEPERMRRNIVVSQFANTLSVNVTRFAEFPGKIPKWLDITPLGPVNGGLVSSAISYDLGDQGLSKRSGNTTVSIVVDVPDKLRRNIKIVAEDGSLIYNENQNARTENPTPTPQDATIKRIESPEPFHWDGERRLAGNMANPDITENGKYVPIRARLNLNPARSAFAPSVKPVPVPAILLVDTSGSILTADEVKTLKEAVMRLLPSLKDPIITIFDAPDNTQHGRPTFPYVLRPFGPGTDPGSIIRNLRFGGNTHGWTALNMAFAQLQELIKTQPLRYPMDIIFVTDGEFTELPDSPEEIAQWAAFCMKNDIRISFVGLDIGKLEFNDLRPNRIRGEKMFQCEGCEEERPKGLRGVLRGAVAGQWFPAVEKQMPIEFELAAVTGGAWIPIEKGKINEAIDALKLLKFQFVSAVDALPRTGTVTVVFQDRDNPNHLIEMTAPIESSNPSVPKAQVQHPSAWADPVNAVASWFSLSLEHFELTWHSWWLHAPSTAHDAVLKQSA
jgi:hypothetical protein